MSDSLHMRQPAAQQTPADAQSARQRLLSLLRREVFNRIERKLVAAFLVVVLVPLLGTALYGNWITSRVLGQKALTAARADLQQRANRIEGYLGGVRNNLLYLSQTHRLTALIEARARRDAGAIAQWRQQLAREFALFAQTHPMYYQIRYITEDGWEFVRVNNRRDIVEIVPEQQLQRKDHRYYFTESIKLGPGDVYVSPVDLNREHGQIEIPHTPVIRYATPVFYADGRRAGIVIVNLYAEEFLRFASDHNHGDVLALVDQDGYYLVHPDPTKTWGRPWDLGTGQRLQVDFPQLWPQILSAEEGIESGNGNVVVHLPVFPSGREEGRYWVLLHVEPKGQLFASVRSFRLTAAAILVAAILGAVAMAILLARSITAPVLALTEEVKRFGEGEAHIPITISCQDEIGELAAAFDEMARALQENLNRLSLLNQSGQSIAAQLERSGVLAAIMEAMEVLFEAEYRVIRFIDSDNDRWAEVITGGDERWAVHAESEEARTARQVALARGEWHTTRVRAGEKSLGIMCCAPLHVRAQRKGLIELYGCHSDLEDPATCNLLATLAVQASIALENAELYGALAEHRAQLQTLVEQLITAQEEERRMVAYDIHDGLIQLLVGARFHLLNFIAQRQEHPEDAEQSLEKGLTHLTAAIREARRVIEGLRPATLDDLGLVPTLEQYAQELAAEAGWEVTVEAHPQNLRLPPMVEITAFRIAQEALTNARRHARTERVAIRLEARDGRLVVEVRDWGQGFDRERVNASNRRIGLISMQERARVLGGDCTIESQPEQGTTVRATLPLPSEEQGLTRGTE